MKKFILSLFMAILLIFPVVAVDSHSATINLSALVPPIFSLDVSFATYDFSPNTAQVDHPFSSLVIRANHTVNFTVTFTSTKNDFILTTPDSSLTPWRYDLKLVTPGVVSYPIQYGTPIQFTQVKHLAIASYPLLITHSSDVVLDAGNYTGDIIITVEVN